MSYDVLQGHRLNVRLVLTAAYLASRVAARSTLITAVRHSLSGRLAHPTITCAVKFRVAPVCAGGEGRGWRARVGLAQRLIHAPPRRGTGAVRLLAYGGRTRSHEARLHAACAPSGPLLLLPPAASSRGRPAGLLIYWRAAAASLAAHAPRPLKPALCNPPASAEPWWHGACMRPSRSLPRLSGAQPLRCRHRARPT